ncbi:hemolysin secretion protein D [Yersinia ruckeri]|uniref:Membrane fusion protein (MFP) family protein n=2 Tax=Yersinia ruckeri TaxID=29486 RepID=A0A0A5HHH2_YERRU|nr:HlyD family type I secretion periplasmic adaptor subunit [Yersinia ruckeri]AUQ41432.1 HlyD family type I secretion periplasmic adaptor subunit [Yersinia ruckeri]EEP99384.1 HlyD family secretion protein [Yersinia ruckeri ATCC 29473]EKN3347415.1 HlyD family type I secretion periplasmic adaptor subunit [Yersinia ruckeri]EKN3362816.1 HlyD family type I secretion periplasmic adaptor subunit [Yersinia ruckeri]EKN4202460.1 HlyD family type I secretion periplasmic adaptor subunit [Yersinia ruckeri]
MMLSEVGRPSLQTNSERYLYIGGLLVLTGFIGFFAWASFAPLDKGVAVPGIVIVAENRKIVQSLQGGRITQLHTTEGEWVEKGQLLISLDDTAIRSQRDNLQQQYFSLLSLEARLIAEQSNSALITFPEALLKQRGQPIIEELMALQQQLLHHRHQVQKGELTRLSTEIARLHERLAGLHIQRVNNQRQSDLIQQQLKGIRALAQNGYVATSQQLEMESKAIMFLAKVDQDNSYIAETHRHIQETEQRLAQQHEQYQADIHEQLAKAQQNRRELGQHITVAEYELANMQISAPASGVIIALAQHTVGGVVGSGQQLMEIVPNGEPLLIEAQLPVELIDKVAVGLPVDLIFSAFNQSHSPRLAGTVLRVGADRLDNRHSLQPYYPLTVSINIDAVQQTQIEKIRPGMSVDVFVRTGERSLLSYLFKPFTDRLQAALAEE